MTIISLGGFAPKYIPKERRKPRSSGSYAQIKIDAFTAYCEASEHVFKSNRANGITGKLVYFEPFCGPGMNRIRETGKLVRGTALLAVEKLKDYDIFIFNDLSKSVLNALYSELVDRGLDQDPKRSIYLAKHDANQVVASLKEILPKKVPGAKHPVMGVAIIDPPGLHFTWDGVMELSKHRLDLVGMLSTYHDLVRNIRHPQGREHVEQWLGESVPADAKAAVARYEAKLKAVAGYTHVHGPTGSPLPGQQDIGVPRAYHLFLATKCPNEVASRIWKGVCKRVSRYTLGTPLLDDAESSEIA